MTCRRVTSLRRKVGIALESPNGWSWCQTSRSTRSTASGWTTNSWWSVACRFAARRAYGRSSKPSRSSKPMVKVCTGPVELAGHDPHDRARVDAAAQEGAERHVGHRAGAGRPPRAARRTSRAASSSEPSSARRAVEAGDRRLPVALDDRLAAGLEGEHVAGRQAADAVEERARRRHVAEGQVGGDRAWIEPARNRGVGEQRLDLAAEDQAPAAATSRTAASCRAGRGRARAAARRSSQTAKANMPSSRRASSHRRRRPRPGARCTSVSPCGAELVPSRAQLVAQLAEVVDLAVEDDRDRRVLVGDRRIAGDEVDDREAVLRDRPGAARELPPGVRAAVVKARELLIDDR